MDYGDIVERGAWTFIQAFLGSIPAGIVLTDKDALAAVALAGLTAGVAALISFAKNVVKQKLEEQV